MAVSAPDFEVTAAHLVAAARCEFSLLTRALRGDLPSSPHPAPSRLEALLSAALSALQEKEADGKPAGEVSIFFRDDGSEGENITEEFHDISHILPVATARKTDLEELVATYVTGSKPLDWFTPEVGKCGVCPECRRQVKKHRDMLLVPGLSMKTRNEIVRDFGIHTIEQLAALEPRYGSLPARVQAFKNAAAVQVGWLSPEQVEEVYPDDAALLDRFGFESELGSAEGDSTAQALLEAAGKDEEADAAEIALADYVASLAGADELSPDELAIAMVASATGYHRRERSQFWTDHFQRLANDIESWEQARNVAIFDRVAVEEDWAKDPERPRAQPSRLLGARARLGEGSSFKPGDSGLFLMYRAPFPPHVAADFAKQVARAGEHHEFDSVRFGAFKASIEEIEPGPSGSTLLKIRESLPRGGTEFTQLPLALTEGQPIATKAQESALKQLAEQVGAALPKLPLTAGVDILRRRRPRLKGGADLPARDEATYGSNATIEAIFQAVSALDDSYVAVQGPPGSGKTHLGAHVIGRLIDRGWKIGVVAQSHAVVENVLAGCIKKGTVRAERVAKFAGKTKMEDAPWGEISEAELSEALVAPEGLLFGGTAWDFASEKKFPEQSLDLLVIDEAGQYSLANTLAVARSARNLLLLGDPQQLPQVTQGEHDYPVDTSALGWLCAENETLPAELGYFLDVSWRMHPALCAPVSALSYEGKLGSAQAGSQRLLEGWEPGIFLAQVEHSGNTTASVQEADEVVRWVREFEGASWTPQLGSTAPRPLTGADVLVVAAYNAQVDLIAEKLAAAGLSEVRVGTVDKFQGQEAPVVLVSMAASSAGESARGAEFLLSANRLNVAISRGQWCAVLIESTQLTRYLPTTVQGLNQLGRFLELNSSARPLGRAHGAGAGEYGGN